MCSRNRFDCPQHDVKKKKKKKKKNIPEELYVHHCENLRPHKKIFVCLCVE
jgi:hypothetical protein